MSVPKNYSRQLQTALAAKAVWEPGSSVALGDILTVRDGLFNPSGQLSEYNIAFTTAPSTDRKLNLRSAGTSEKVFQAGVEISAANIDPQITASVEYKFTGEFEYLLKTEDLDVEHIVNINTVAKAVLGVDEWKHDKWYIVERLYKAGDWSFVGNRKTSKVFKLSGKGSAIKQFLDVGASAGISSTGDVSIQMLGKGGALAMRLVRIRKDGTTNRG